jgi:hypothetical protein
VLDIFSVAVVVIRGLALLIISSAIPAIPSILAAIKRGSYEESYNSVVADPHVSPLVIGWLGLILLATLWLIFAKKLAKFLTRGLENTNVQTDENNLSALQKVAFSVLGAYVIVYALPSLVKIAAIGFLNATRKLGEASYATTSSAEIVEVVARLSLGLWLLLGSRQITNSVGKVWTKLRSSFAAE